MLLEDWVETLQQKGKEQGVTGGNGKWTKRLTWLQEHWGTGFKTKGSTALRKMPLSGVIELLTLYALSTADLKDDLEFGSFEMGTDLTDKVNTALTALKDKSVDEEGLETPPGGLSDVPCNKALFLLLQVAVNGLLNVST